MRNKLNLRINKEDFKKKLDIKDGIDGSPDNGPDIVEKINDIPVTGAKIDASHIKNFSEVIQSAGKKIASFLHLTDTPTSYSGQSGKTLKVKTTEDGLEFGTASGSVEGTDVLSTGEAGGTKYLREDGDGTCSWQTPAGAGDLLADGTVPLTANWDVGAYTITGTQFISDIATGTAPFVVASTTAVDNLNADLLDGQEGSYYLDSANSNSPLGPNVLIVGSTGAPYTTISAAITAADAGDTILVEPNTYTETLTLAANNITIIGQGKPNSVIVQQADANVVDFNSRTGIQLKNMTLQVTAATSAIATVTGTTGSCSLKGCHTKMTTTANITAVAQPAIGDVTSTGTLTLTLGQFTYAHSGDGGGTAIKGAFKVGTGAMIKLEFIGRGTITTSGTELATAIAVDLDTTGVVQMHDCIVDITDTGTLVTGLAYLGGTGITHEYYRNTIHVDGTGCTNAYGFYAADSVTVTRSFYNHIHVTGATNNYSFFIAASATVVSELDDIVAANGVLNAGTYTVVNSPSDGDLSASGTIKADTHVNIDSQTASEIASFDASKNVVSLAVATYPSLAELAYVKGVSSGIQGQLGGKQATISFGTGVETALGVNIGSAGAPIVFDGDAGTPSALVGTNISGTASSLTAGVVTNATLATALTVDTGTVGLTGNVANNSVLTIGAGAVSVSGANTGDDPGLENVVEDTTPQLGGDLDLNEHYLQLEPSPASDHTASGLMASETVDANTYGIASALHRHTDGDFIEADADAATTMPCHALALETGTGTKKVLLQGYIRDDTWNWTLGAPIYVSATVGTLTQTAPSGSGDQVQIVGHAVSADIMYFDPSPDLIELA